MSFTDRRRQFRKVLARGRSVRAIRVRSRSTRFPRTSPRIWGSKLKDVRGLGRVIHLARGARSGGASTLTEFAEQIRRITQAGRFRCWWTRITGYGNALNGGYPDGAGAGGNRRGVALTIEIRCLPRASWGRAYAVVGDLEEGMGENPGGAGGADRSRVGDRGADQRDFGDRARRDAVSRARHYAPGRRGCECSHNRVYVARSSWRRCAARRELPLMLGGTDGSLGRTARRWRRRGAGRAARQYAVHGRGAGGASRR